MLCEVQGHLSKFVLRKAIKLIRVFPSGGDWGDPPMSSMSPLITAVPPHKIQKLSPPSLLILTKIFLDIFSIFA